MFYLLFLLLSSAIIISIIRFSSHYGISPTPSGWKVSRQLVNHLPSSFKGNICDLGSGFGHLAWLIARRCPEATVTGIEISPIPFFISTLLFRRSNLCYIRKDFFKISLTPYQIIVCYLYSGGMKALSQKFSEESQGALVISHTFALPGFDPSWQSQVSDLYHTPIYGYEI